MYTNGNLKMKKFFKLSPQKPEIKKVWKNSDDGIYTVKLLSDIYPKVPKELDISVEVLELHNYMCRNPLKRKVIDWLNK